MPVSPEDKEVLRALAAEVARIAHLPVQDEKAELWRRLNRLQKVRPLVWINEICWEEMGPELDLKTGDEFARGQERNLRQVLYQWRHMPADMVVDANLWCPIVIHDSGHGMNTIAVRTGDGPGTADYVSIIRSEADVERIQMPRVTVDWQATRRNHERMLELFGDIMPVEVRGVTGTWFAPWDTLIQWYGIEELYTDIMDRPKLVHKAIDRMVQAMISRFEQYEALGVLAPNNCNCRVGSGGLGFTDELPAADFDGRTVRMIDMWGNSTAQIFSEVSPAMHEEFALRYELRILERFGLNCYGCCEPLHKKIGILRQIPRLRRISMSPFVNVAEGAAAIGDRYVFSAKPNPAVLAGESWNPDRARKELREILDKTRSCHVELIMKDITTVRNEPRRLWEWSQIAMDLAEEFAP